MLIEEMFRLLSQIQILQSQRQCMKFTLQWFQLTEFISFTQI